MAIKILTVHFTNNGSPAPGLTPTIDIYELDPLVPTTNTLVVNDGACAEIGGGWYRYQFTTYDTAKNYVFTFDGGGSLAAYERYKVGGNETYAEEVSDGVWDEQGTEHVQPGSMGLIVQQTKADTASIVVTEATIVTLLNLLLKYQRNRTRIDLANAQLIIYDDDCVTPLTTFNLLDFSGMPNVQEVCEKIPVTCP
jgi:hypothetical protein